jgi:hypothetical protein
MSDIQALIGRVTRCSTRGFVGAIRLPEPQIPVFGGFCQAEAQQGRSQVVGLIYDISIQDDEFARQMAATETAPAEVLADGQANRQVPVEFSALAVGYTIGQAFYHRLPPQPPLTLAPIHRMKPEDILAFTDHFDFLPLVLSAPQLPADLLLAAALQSAAEIRPEAQRRPFLIDAGRACARLMAGDLPQLQNLLRSLTP